MLPDVHYICPCEICGAQGSVFAEACDPQLLVPHEGKVAHQMCVAMKQIEELTKRLERVERVAHRHAIIGPGGP